MKYLILILFFTNIQAQTQSILTQERSIQDFWEKSNHSSFILNQQNKNGFTMSNRNGVLEVWKKQTKDNHDFNFIKYNKSNSNQNGIQLRFTTNDGYILEGSVETDTRKGVSTSVIASVDGYIKFEEYLDTKKGKEIPPKIITNLYKIKQSKELDELMQDGINEDDLEDFIINNFVFSDENSSEFLNALGMMNDINTKDGCNWLGAGTGLTLAVYVNCAVCGASGGWGAPACGTCVAELVGAGIAVGAYFSECFPSMPDYEPTPTYDPNNPPTPPPGANGPGSPWVIGGGGIGSGLIGIPVYGQAIACDDDGNCTTTTYIKYWIWLRE